MLEYIKAVGTGLFIAFMVTQLVCLGEGNGTSMLPLLRDGDYFIMSKIVKEVERGDVVGVEDINQNKLLVKRIVATEGDFVEVTPTGQFYLNGELQIEDYIYEQDWKGYSYVKGIVPEGHYFVMGDNRSVSYDSRYDLGFVPKNQITRKVIFNLTKFKESILNKVTGFKESTYCIIS